MNDLNLAHISEDPSTYRFGLSTLRAWIRCFEYLLHISYRLPIKKWQAKGKDKEIVKIRKQEINTKFRTELGLRVDQPIPGGSGKTNDGNIARRFFFSAKKSSDVDV